MLCECHMFQFFIYHIHLSVSIFASTCHNTIFSFLFSYPYLHAHATTTHFIPPFHIHTRFIFHHFQYFIIVLCNDCCRNWDQGWGHCGVTNDSWISPRPMTETEVSISILSWFFKEIVILYLYLYPPPPMGTVPWTSPLYWCGC